MGIFFGTDGVRGIVNNDLTDSLAQMLGNALARKKKNAKIIVGRDTRVSGAFVVAAFSAGAMKGGANVIDVGIAPTAAISYLVRNKHADFGVVVSASHNPKEYNGIKIFDKDGRKLNEKEETLVERYFCCPLVQPSIKVGKSKYLPSYVNCYQRYLQSCVGWRFDGLKIVLDCANGAAYKIAPRIFKNLGAEVVKINCCSSGKKINENCGATNVVSLQKKVVECGADAGFAFDGDSDRVMAVDEKGNVLDGDQLIYILAKSLAKKGELSSRTVVGTSHTNTGLALALNSQKINLIRTDIGDKYVIEAMEKMDLSLGGEQSGHIILRSFLPTGDGILSALKICEIIKEEKTTLSKLFDAQLLHQVNKNIVVSDKLKVLNNEFLSQKISQIHADLSPIGRVLVRASGTEPKIRIMVEHQDRVVAEKAIKEIEDVIKKI